MANRIIRNAARCKKCGDVIESKHRHDFVSCKCGAIAVDGGTDYIRWIFNDRDDIEDLCEVEE
jgi:hypothetical protein